MVGLHVGQSAAAAAGPVGWVWGIWNPGGGVFEDEKRMLCDGALCVVSWFLMCLCRVGRFGFFTGSNRSKAYNQILLTRFAKEETEIFRECVISQLGAKKHLKPHKKMKNTQQHDLKPIQDHSFPTALFAPLGCSRGPFPFGYATHAHAQRMRRCL